MKQPCVLLHRDLFDDGSRRIVMPLDQKQQLIDLIAYLLIEITTSISKLMPDLDDAEAVMPENPRKQGGTSDD
jgi:hypothetical protein